jgi:hypothetical protein
MTETLFRYTESCRSRVRACESVTYLPWGLGVRHMGLAVTHLRHRIGCQVHIGARR